MRCSESGTLRMRNMVSARRVSSGRSTVLNIVIVCIVVFGVFALLKVNSGAQQEPTEELLTGSIARSPAVRNSPSNDSMDAFLSTQPIIRSMQSTVADRAAVPLRARDQNGYKFLTSPQGPRSGHAATGNAAAAPRRWRTPPRGGSAKLFTAGGRGENRQLPARRARGGGFGRSVHPINPFSTKGFEVRRNSVGNPARLARDVGLSAAPCAAALAFAGRFLRESVCVPSGRLLAEVRQDFAGVGGDVRFFRTTADLYSYREVFSDVVGLVHLQGGQVAGIGGDLRMLDHFQMGPNLARPRTGSSARSALRSGRSQCRRRGTGDRNALSPRRTGRHGAHRPDILERLLENACGCARDCRR
jgi:hypothetical protein